MSSVDILQAREGDMKLGERREAQVDGSSLGRGSGCMSQDGQLSRSKARDVDCKGGC